MIAPIIRMATALVCAAQILPIACISADFVTFSSTASINIADNRLTLPIPTINATAIPFTPTRFTLSVFGITHTYINDVALAVVSPQGVKVLLVSGTGPEGGEDGPGVVRGVTDQNWTFDDAAAQQMPQSVVPTSGTYRPGMRLDDYLDDFSSPDGTVNYGTADTFDTDFARLIGVDPLGTWRLLIRDSQRVDRGTISGGWSITFDNNVTAVPEPSALALGLLAFVPLVARRYVARRKCQTKSA